MFRRNFSSKSKSLIKSSEWKHLKSNLTAQFPAFKSYLSTITKCLAERVIFDTEKFVVTLYWDEVHENLILINPAKDIYIPSLPACWEVHFHHNGLPILLVDARVMKIIQGGAHLMAPGILGHIPTILINQVVGVAVIENPRIILALGVSQMNTTTIITERSGKAVHIYHSYGDNLWMKSGKPKFPDIACPSVLDTCPLAVIEEPDFVCVSHEDVTINYSEISTPMSVLSMNDDLEYPELAPNSSTGSEDPDSEMHQAFLFGLIDLLNSPDMHELSIGGSIFYSRYMQPHLPNQALEFRATKWKKLAKFLKSMEKEYRQNSGFKLITLKEMSSGEIHLTSIFNQHPVLQDAKKELKKKTRAVAPSMEPSAPQNPPSCRFSVTELYHPDNSMDLIFPDTTVQLKRSEVTQVLNTYFETANLVNAKNQHLIQINDALEPYALSLLSQQNTAKNAQTAHARKDTKKNGVHASGKEEGLQRQQVKRDQLHAAIMDEMHRVYSIKDTLHGTERTETKMHGIEVFVDRRVGRKLVTVIKYLFLAVPELAGNKVQTELSNLCACSVSVGPYPGVGAAKGHVIQIQGDQLKQVRKWCTQLGIIQMVKFIDLGVHNKKKGKAK